MPAKVVDIGDLKSFVVISDVHLRTPKENKAQLLCQTIRTLPKVEAIVLLGDIFDFIFVGSPYLVNFWEPIFTNLRERLCSGTQIFLLEGNHDFGFETFFPKNLAPCFTNAGDFELHAKHPVAGILTFTHGDDIVCPPHYPKFRHFVKSRNFHRFVKLWPGKFMNWFFSRYATTSRNRDEYRKLNLEFFRKKVNNYLIRLPQEQKPQHLFLGHVHTNIDEVISDTRVISGPSWLTAPGYFLMDSSGSVNYYKLSQP